MGSVMVDSRLYINDLQDSRNKYTLVIQKRNVAKLAILQYCSLLLLCYHSHV